MANQARWAPKSTVNRRLITRVRACVCRLSPDVVEGLRRQARPRRGHGREREHGAATEALAAARGPPGVSEGGPDGGGARRGRVGDERLRREESRWCGQQRSRARAAR